MYITFIVILAGIMANAIASESVLLADSLSDYVPWFVILQEKRVLFVNTEGEMRTASIDDPGESESFEVDWDPEGHGWANPWRVGYISTNPRGDLICFTQQISVPDILQSEDRFIPGPVAVIICESDGSNPRLVALSFEVGGGPQFDFTQDSEYLFGTPLLGCYPSPDEFVSYWSGGDDHQDLDGFLIDVEDGQRSGGSAIISDGYHKNPWSDLVATGSHPPNCIADIAAHEILLESDTYNSYGIIQNWVLPDAGLVEEEGHQLLRYSDGTEVFNRRDKLIVYSRLSNGKYVFRLHEGESVLLGYIDWHDFSTSDVDTLTDLGGVLNPWSTVLEVPDSDALIFACRGSIYRCDLPADN